MNEKFEGKKLFETMEGYEYFVSQLTELPEEDRAVIAAQLLWHIENGYNV